jgi:hypothetical protein
VPIRVISGFILCVVAGPAVTAEIFEMMDIFSTQTLESTPGSARGLPRSPGLAGVLDPA